MKKSYIHYKFTGVRSFTDILNESETDYVLFEDGIEEAVKMQRPDIFASGDDSIRTGFCKNGSEGVYFSEFAIQITKSFRSHVVFIFDHHPAAEELIDITDNLSSLIEKALDNADLSAITAAAGN